MMEPNQDKQRDDADQEFQKSLEQLEDILQEDATATPGKLTSHDGSINQVEPAEDMIAIDLAALEDAVADIEEYLEKKTKQ